jgi:hypothetical protein
VLLTENLDFGVQGWLFRDLVKRLELTLRKKMAAWSHHFREETVAVLPAALFMNPVPASKPQNLYWCGSEISASGNNQGEMGLLVAVQWGDFTHRHLGLLLFYFYVSFFINQEVHLTLT